MKIQAENKAHTPCYPVIAAVAAAMLALPACEAPQALKGQVKPKVESKEVGKDQRSEQLRGVPQERAGSKEAGKKQRSQQPVIGKTRIQAPAKPERPPQGVCGRKKVAPPKQ